MRWGLRVLAMGITLSVSMALAACDDNAGRAMQLPTSSETASPSSAASPSPTPSPSQTVDPAATAEVCGLSKTSMTTTVNIFNAQMAAFEQAAAHGDNPAMLNAAKAINEQFVSLANTFTQLAKRDVSNELRTVLTDISTALTEMSSLTYVGTTTDIRKKLTDFTAALDSTCATPTSTGSPTPTS
jgi:hypothetical protein